jgi:hypothetical protein
MGDYLQWYGDVMALDTAGTASFAAPIGSKRLVSEVTVTGINVT